MINPNELRIGSYVKKGEAIYKIEWGSQIDNSDYFYPIPLTPEILDAAGFENHEDHKDWYFTQNGVKIARLASSEYACSNMMDIKVQSFNYVHQLQNLYYALTGSELTLNPDLIKSVFKDLTIEYIPKQ
jgi:hypothetical protein